MTATVENSPGVAEWVKVLRETDKPQARGALYRTTSNRLNPEGFCCLGIWCDYLVSKNEFGLKVEEANNQVYYDDNPSTLPVKAQVALGVDNHNPNIHIENIHYDRFARNEEIIEVSPENIEYYRDNNPKYLVNAGVAELNDEAKLTFSQIADLVEYAGLS